MKSFAGKLSFVLVLLLVFAYGLVAGKYDFFPEPQISAIKNYIAPSWTLFIKEPDNVKSKLVYDSFLQRLLIKKVKLPGSTDHGGALSVSGKMLFLATNKGNILPYDLEQYTLVENNLVDVPMNLDGLYRSGHPDRNFRIDWFRVNGLHSEVIDDHTYELFVSHNAYIEDNDCITHNITKTRVSIERDSLRQVNKWETIFTASPCIDPEPEKIAAAKPYPGHISGGPMIEFDDNRLLVAVGDYNRHGIGGIEEWAMNPSNPYGKTILLDKKSGAWSVFSMGNRNISGLLKDNNGNIWSVENGPRGGDELNILKEGNNYGWPRVSYGLWYDHSFELIGHHKAGTHPEFTTPVYSWVPSVAPRGLVKINSGKFDYWEDDFVMGTMTDNSLHRLRLDEDNRVMFDERIEIGHRIRDVQTLPDGKLVLITDDDFLIIIDDGGAVYEEINSEVKTRLNDLEKFEIFSAEKDSSSSSEFRMTSQQIFQNKCSSCHNLNPVNGIGPHLSNLFNRTIGEVEGYNSSQTLNSDTRTWNAKLLRSYLENPGKEFQGTRMQEVNLTSAQIDSLVNYFDSQ